MECLLYHEHHGVMMPKSCFYEISWNFMKFHENMTLVSWLHDVNDLKDIPLKSPANFAFKTGFVFMRTFINNEIWAVNFFYSTSVMKSREHVEVRTHVGSSEKWHVGKSDLIQMTSNIKTAFPDATFARFWRYPAWILRLSEQNHNWHLQMITL